MTDEGPFRDGRWWTLGVVGALAATAAASSHRTSGSPVRVGPRLRPDPEAPAVKTARQRQDLVDRVVDWVAYGGKNDSPAWRPGGLNPTIGAAWRFGVIVAAVVGAIRTPDEQSDLAHALFDRRPTVTEREFLRAADDETFRYEEALRKGEPPEFMGAGTGIGRHLPARIERLAPTDKRRALATEKIRVLLETPSDDLFARMIARATQDGSSWLSWASSGSLVRVGPRLRQQTLPAEDLLRMVRADLLRVRTRLRDDKRLDAETRARLTALEVEYDPLIWQLRQAVVDETGVRDDLRTKVINRSQPDTWPLLFVYGSLRRGESGHDQLGDAIFLGAVSLSGFKRLRYSQTIMPSIPSDTVRGELYQIHPKVLPSLDAWEASGGFYRRVAKLEDGRWPFWVSVYMV
jgi:gamma-glutamylcyclotransferase (GGCT)/AIG2-like uncharacterized protein YtfP